MTRRSGMGCTDREERVKVLGAKGNRRREGFQGHQDLRFTWKGVAGRSFTISPHTIARFYLFQFPFLVLFLLFIANP